MKIIYQDLIKFLDVSPSKKELSDKLFQLGHEHEIVNDVIELDLTPNRGDCLSLAGIARDLNIFFGKGIKPKSFDDVIEELELDFENLAHDDCPKISFLEIEVRNHNPKYLPYMEDYFDKLNFNKVNFFTDVSNYLSYEMGQPTHCYDRNKINNKITFERKDLDNNFKTLLGNKIKISGDSCVFMMDKDIINLAGVMGGDSTACSKDTKIALVECAFFRPESIIGKSIKYNLVSDAAHKFERGVDIGSQEKILRRFIQIVKDHTEIESLKIKTFDYIKTEHECLDIDVNKINKILGTSISELEYLKILESLDFSFAEKIIVPSFRHDIKTQNDLSEEIARVIGYNNIQNEAIPSVSQNKKQKLKKRDIIRNFLTKKGFAEVINFPFQNEEEGISIKIDNPLDSNRKNMRISLKNSMLENLLYNERRQKESIKFFEISNVFIKDNQGYKSKEKLGIIAAGRVGNNHRDFLKKIDKSYLENIFSMNIHVEEISRKNIDTKKKSRIFYVEIDLDEVPESFFDENNLIDANTINFIDYLKISEFPSSTRDFSFSIDEPKRVNQILDYFDEIKDENLKECFMFDFYNDENTGIVKIGYRLVFQSFTKTLKEEDINKSVKRILSPVLVLEGVSIPGMN